MTQREKCPHCGVSLIGNEIPEENRHLFGGATHFYRDILVSVLGVYDGYLFHRCPDCKGEWHRWPEGHELRKVASAHMKGC